MMNGKGKELKCESAQGASTTQISNEAKDKSSTTANEAQQSIEIAISHTSSLLSKKSSEGNTHKWAISVKATQGGHDKSDIIKQVIFRLHESFKKPVRVLSSQPFMLAQKGWGSFSLKVDIVLKNSQKLSFPYDLVLNSLDEPTLVNTDRHKVILKDSDAVSTPKPATKPLVSNETAPECTLNHAQKTIEESVTQCSNLSLSKLESKAQADAKKFNQFFGDPIIESSNGANRKKPKYDTDTPEKSIHKSNQLTKPAPVKNLNSQSNETTVSSDEESLVELQHKIQFTQDMEALRNIVKCVENSGCLQKTQTTYDFDLNELDSNTLVQIRKILEL